MTSTEEIREIARQMEKRNGKASNDTELLAIIEGLRTVLGSASNIVVELIRAAANMPLLAAVLSLWLNAILAKLQLIDKLTQTAVAALVITAAGVTLTDEIISAISNLEKILPFTSPSTATDGLLKPGATVIVYGSGQQQDLQALMSTLKGLPSR